jgi:hypothetical protein
MRFVAADLPLIVTLLIAGAIIAAAVGVLAWRRRSALRNALTADEWGMLVRLAAIPLLILALLAAHIASVAPAEMFLYGRF